MSTPMFQRDADWYRAMREAKDMEPSVIGANNDQPDQGIGHSTAGAGDAPPEAAHVRLHDVLGTVDGFFAEHPELDRSLLSGLSGALSALERLA